MRHVLIVDDNSDIRILLKLAFEAENYAVHQAENGSIAQEQLRSGLRPSIILLDLMMPIMDGREFLRWKNQNAELDDLPVFVISALHDSAGLDGANAYLNKPIDLNELFDLVGNLIGSKMGKGM